MDRDEWFRRKLELLLRRRPPPTSRASDLFEARPWTPLKLIVLDWYLGIYFPRLRRRYESLVFVDLFAGSGACYYRRGGFDLPGSSLVASSYRKGFEGRVGNGSFDKIIANEVRSERLAALVEHVRAQGYRQGEVAAFRGKAEDNVESILREIPRSQAHVLLLADPENLVGLPFSIIRHFVRRHDATDVIINHLVSGSARDAGREGLVPFYEGRAESGMDREQVSRLYFDMVREIRPNAVKIRINAGGESEGYYYDLILATRHTGGGNPWAQQSFPDLKAKIESFSGRDVDRVMRTLTPYESGGRRHRQLKLDER